MEYKGVANYHSDWDMESQFLTEDLQKVLNTKNNKFHISVFFIEITYRLICFREFGTKSKASSKSRMLKAKSIGVRWYIGLPSACYAADPGWNPGEARNDYANRSFPQLRFIFGLYGSVGWQTIAGRLSRLEALKRHKSWTYRG